MSLVVIPSWLVAGSVTAALIGIWWFHVARLRARERDLMLMVDEMTRQWQGERRAHARLRAEVTAALDRLPGPPQHARVAEADSLEESLAAAGCDPDESAVRLSPRSRGVGPRCSLRAMAARSGMLRPVGRLAGPSTLVH